MESNYYTEIYDSVTQIRAAEWLSLIDPVTDVAMDQRLIALLEKTLSDQAQFWIVVIRDQQHQLVACACLSLFHTDIIQSSSELIQKAMNNLRRFWSQALKVKVLFCGLPLPAGSTHLRIKTGADLAHIYQLITAAMTEIANKNKARLLVFKELSDTELLNFDLQNLGFIKGELQPMFQLPGRFKNFEEYYQALRATYRHQVKANIKKFNQLDMQIEFIHNPQEICERFNETLHQLYLNVWQRAKEKLECFSLQFFHELARAFPGQVILTIISHETRPVAFLIGFISDEEYYSLYVGMDYSYLKKVDLYFNLYYQVLDSFFRLNKKRIWMGQTSGAFKSRLGARAEPRYFWVKPVNSVLQIIFKFFHTLIFPKMEPVQEYQVFNKKNFLRNIT